MAPTKLAPLSDGGSSPTYPTGSALGVEASGTVPTTLPTPIVIEPLGVCVEIQPGYTGNEILERKKAIGLHYLFFLRIRAPKQ